MEPVSFAEIKGFFEDDLNYALEVFKKDCQNQKMNNLKVYAKKLTALGASAFGVRHFAHRYLGQSIEDAKAFARRKHRQRRSIR